MMMRDVLLREGSDPPDLKEMEGYEPPVVMTPVASPVDTAADSAPRTKKGSDS
jgi:hypothetical protein